MKHLRLVQLLLIITGNLYCNSSIRVPLLNKNIAKPLAGKRQCATILVRGQYFKENLRVLSSSLVRQSPAEFDPSDHNKLQSPSDQLDDAEGLMPLKSSCKRFNKLCVKGNALICGSLNVCCNVHGTSLDPIIGPAGTIGNTGATGFTGDTGVTGFSGSLGARGLQGVTGATGQPGTTGATGFTGSDGTDAPTGFTGNTGQNGATGDTGTSGLDGARGVIGLTGPTGFTGFTGFTGPQGQTGLGEADQAFAYLYSTAATSVSGGSGFAGSTAVPFDTNAELVGFAHVPGSGEIIIERTGLYEVTFTVTSVTNNLLALYQNGTFIAGSRYWAGSSNKQNSGTVVVQLNAGDVLTLRNETTPNIGTPTTLTTNPSAGPNPAIINVCASILLRQFA